LAEAEFPENPMSISSPLLRAVVKVQSATICAIPSEADAMKDVDALLSSFKLQLVRRYFHQVHWDVESKEAAFSDRAEPGLKLENVAAHSWHVGDAALLLAPHFPNLDREKVLALALLHDKLEMFTGDFDPVGNDGQGGQTHAFDDDRRREKVCAEETALKIYLSQLRESAQHYQGELLSEMIRGVSSEALFVKAIDKLQALAYVYLKKNGNISDAHLVFSIRYSRKAIEFFTGISIHYSILLDRLIDSVASFRGVQRRHLDNELFSQLELDLRPPK